MNYDEAVAEVVAKRDNLVISTEKALAAAERAKPVLQKLKQMGFEPNIYLQTWNWLGMAWGEASISVKLQDQDSWACALPIMEGLEELGFLQESWRSHDDAKNFARSFTASSTLEGDSWKEEVKIRITVMLREGNTGGCRRVFVGTEKETTTTETEKYELVCDEETPA